MNTEKEKGAAQICITLSDGVITVRHTHESGDILFQKNAFTGDWDRIWIAIRGVTYKVEHLESGASYYTNSKKDAIKMFDKFKIDFGDMIRLYEAPIPINDHDEIEWEIIDYYEI